MEIKCQKMGFTLLGSLQPALTSQFRQLFQPEKKMWLDMCEPCFKPFFSPYFKHVQPCLAIFKAFKMPQTWCLSESWACFSHVLDLFIFECFSHVQFKASKMPNASSCKLHKVTSLGKNLDLNLPGDQSSILYVVKNAPQESTFCLLASPY